MSDFHEKYRLINTLQTALEHYNLVAGDLPIVLEAREAADRLHRILMEECHGEIVDDRLDALSEFLDDLKSKRNPVDNILQFKS